jgi:outer membrane cobalamin receptor
MESPVNYATLIAPDREPAKPDVDFLAKHRRSVSLFGIDEWSPYTWMVFAGGARYRIEGPNDDKGGKIQQGVNLQGAAVLAGKTSGAKLVYSEGYRVVDGNSLYSTSGVYGNASLEAERSREVSAQVHHEVLSGVTASVGGNVTRLSNLIGLRVLTPDEMTMYGPKFTRIPENSGSTDIVGGYAEVRGESELVDTTLNYSYYHLDESKPINHGIPYAPHTLFGTVVVRPARDVSMFARSTVTSHRYVDQLVPGGIAYRRLPWAVRLALGVTFANVLSGFDLDLRIDNPFNFKRKMPYDLTGTETFVEERSGSEVFATLRWNH